MTTYKTRSTSRNSVDVEDIILDEAPGHTRKIFRPQITRKDGKVYVRGYIIHQRKNVNDDWEDTESINLNTLKGGEGVKLLLRSKQMNRLFEALNHLYEIAKDGLPRGEKEWTVERADQIIKVDASRRVFVQRLLEQDFGDEIWQELLDQKPDLATKLANARIQQNRENSLKHFTQSLERTSQLDEQWWQKYFEKNTWIFGYGLNYRFLHLLEDQPDYGGRGYTGKGSQKGDFLMNTEAKVRFTVLVEIKKPDTPFFQKNSKKELKRHRNGALLLHDELTGGVSQLQSNCHRWYTEGSKRTDDFEQLTSQEIFTYQPKGILVIGDTNQLQESVDARSTFELYRRNLSNPEIITFDELYERAKFIVNQQELNSVMDSKESFNNVENDEFEDWDNDLPF
ncbi:MAG: DUF4263 domain-containing protein [Gracilimonas sp.]|uniref:Shedu immune nuclease family protein n=1 Tax=Gracilimonas sp. TaxID=1974203 RepID=UPI001B08BB06|nr:Shedu immune nuclease family protein [Gracilimonas sp.]MBO6584748.1 DUF4263 domain-containing protein [Gracilimonas sp.]MBO6615981.1 DUF4263 domain-containing protein [Gracilimonas sp.]